MKKIFMKKFRADLISDMSATIHFTAFYLTVSYLKMHITLPAILYGYETSVSGSKARIWN
jgi:hypothetical protein